MTIDVSIEDLDLVVAYNVAGVSEGQLFDVSLYSSKDNFSTPLTCDNIQGTVGYKIPIESTNSIIVKNPLEVLEGISNVSFKVKLELVYNPVTLREPSGEAFKQRRKKPMTVLWRGGLKNEPINFDLYRYDELVEDDFYSTRNNGSAEFKMPKVDKGEGYSMRMDFNSMDVPVELPPLTVKSKKSGFARIFNLALLYAIADAGVYFGAGIDTPLMTAIVGSHDEDDIVPQDPTVSPLPDAPDAPGGISFTIPFFR